MRPSSWLKVQDRRRGAPLVTLALIPFLWPAPKPLWKLMLTAFLMGAGDTVLQRLHEPLPTPPPTDDAAS